MFTSRAEYRLALRADNADQRLTPRGIELGCVGYERATEYSKKASTLEAATLLAKNSSFSPSEAAGVGIQVNRDGIRRTAFELLSYPDVSLEQVLRACPLLAEAPPRILRQLEVDAKYHVYLDRQRTEIESLRREEARALPTDLDYASVVGLSNEVRAKLDQVKPATLAQAGRLEGMTPAALSLLLAHLKKTAA